MLPTLYNPHSFDASHLYHILHLLIELIHIIIVVVGQTIGPFPVKLPLRGQLMNCGSHQNSKTDSWESFYDKKGVIVYLGYVSSLEFGEVATPREDQVGRGISSF